LQPLIGRDDKDNDGSKESADSVDRENDNISNLSQLLAEDLR
jgi:hypothetical protein